MRHQLSRLMAGAVCAVLTFSVHAATDQDVVGQFDIARFAVDGNTLLAQQEVDQTLQAFIGKSRNFGDVQMALEALEAAYRKRGFNVVQVVLPEQELNQGVVVLRVIETKIGTVRIEGNETFDNANIRRSVPGLVEGQTPNLGKISSSLKLANENPAKKTVLQLQGSDKDDEVDALLKVSDDRQWRVSAFADNNGTESTGESQFTLQYQHANVAGLDHVLSLQYTTTIEHPNRLGVYGIGYHVPLYALGDSIDVFASYSDVDSGSVLAGIFNMQVSGKGSVFGGRYNQNLRRVGDYDSKLIYGLDYKEFKNNVSMGGVPLGNDITVHPLSLAYTGSLALAASDASFALTALRNVPGGDKGGSADFNRMRLGAADDYSILRYNAGYSRTLPADWQMRLNFSGQYTADALIPGEQFGAGGAATVRGFSEREFSSDVGYLFNAEVYTPNLCGDIQNIATQCRALAFYDTARLRRNDSLPGEVAKASIGSVGLGFRLNVVKAVALQMDVGRVVDAGPTSAKGDTRMHFRFGLTY